MTNDLLHLTQQQNQTRTKRRPLTVWELPDLLKPMYGYRKSTAVPKKDRKHFAAILGFVYRNRFVVSSQVQRRFVSVIRSDRTARRHLAEMESLGYLALAPTRSTSPLFPKVYFVTSKGLRKLRRALAAKNKPAEFSRFDRALKNGYSADHVLHEVLTTEFLLNIWQATEGHPDLELLSIQRRSLERHPAFRVSIAGKISRLKPDGMFLMRQGPGRMVYFFEMDTGTMSTSQLSLKLARYSNWEASEAGRRYLTELYSRHGAKEPRPTYRLLIVTMHQSGSTGSERLPQLLGVVHGSAATVRDRIWLTAANDLRGPQESGILLDCAVWRRGRELSRTPIGGGRALSLHRLFE